MPSTLLSGSVGYTLLEYNNMFVLLFADIHDGIEYCKKNDTEFIASFLNRTGNKQKNKILLEEIIREQFKLTELWPNAKHTQELKVLNKDNQNIIPVDIRPMLIPFSWELVSTNDNLGSIPLLVYINNLQKLFNQESTIYTKYFLPHIEEMKKRQTSITDSKLSPLIHFNELKLIFDEFKKNYIDSMDKPVYFLVKTNIQILYRINNLISMIMEWYIVLLIHTEMKNTIIHVGLAHSNRLLLLLQKVYRFKIISQTGINEMSQLSSSVPYACVMLSEDINNMYNRKYGFYN